MDALSVGKCSGAIIKHMDDHILGDMQHVLADMVLKFMITCTEAVAPP